MGIEIERKFLVLNGDWRLHATDFRRFRQGYLSSPAAHISVRVRVVDETAAFLTLKSHQQGFRRDEYEYPIPVEDGRSLLQSAIGCVIEKRRCIVVEGQTRWEVDEFEGANAGLIVAEVELASETSPIERPSWLGQEITSDIRYANASLADKPFATW